MKTKKALSQFVSVILLIAISITIFGILSTWLIDYTKKMGSDVAKNSENKLVCSGGAIDGDVNVCEYTNTINITIENSGDISLGNITLQIVYPDRVNKVYLCSSIGYTFSCSKEEANLTLRPGDIVVFNNESSSVSNIQRIIINTNCSNVERSIDSYEFTNIC